MLSGTVVSEVRQVARIAAQILNLGGAGVSSH